MTTGQFVTPRVSRRMFLAGTGAAAALVITGCGTSNAPASGSGGSGDVKTGKVANVNLLNNPWTNQMGTAAEQTAKILGLEYAVATFDVDPAKAVSTAQSFVSSGVQMMFIQASDGSEIPQVMRAAQQGKVYTSDMEALLPWFSPFGNDYFVWYFAEDFTSDYTETAKYTLKAITDKAGPTAKVLVITGFPGSSPDIQTRIGLDAALREFPQVQVLGSQAGNWSAEGGLKATQNLISRYGKPDGILCYNDGMCTGTLAGLKGLQLQPGQDVLVNSLDAVPDIVDAVERGEVVATGGPPPQFFGVASVVAVFDALNGHKRTAPERQMLATGPPITKENVGDYKKRYANPAILPFDPKKMSRVLAGNDWDPQASLTPVDMEAYWTPVKPKPENFKYPEEYQQAVDSGQLKSVAEQYAAANKIKINDYAYPGVNV
jgi:ribose transport system substrate-binding protein